MYPIVDDDDDDHHHHKVSSIALFGVRIYCISHPINLPASTLSLTNLVIVRIYNTHHSRLKTKQSISVCLREQAKDAEWGYIYHAFTPVLASRTMPALQKSMPTSQAGSRSNKSKDSSSSGVTLLETCPPCHPNFQTRNKMPGITCPIQSQLHHPRYMHRLHRISHSRRAKRLLLHFITSD